MQRAMVGFEFNRHSQLVLALGSNDFAVKSLYAASISS